MRVVKITEQQLKEAEGFTFLDSENDTPNGDGQTHISVGGRLDGDTMAKPIDTDSVKDTITANAYNRYYDRYYGIKRPLNCSVNENQDMDGDTDNNGVDDFFEKPELDNSSKNDIVQIPQGVQRKVDLLLNDMKRLSPKQQAIVLDKVIESLNLSSLPPSYLKNLRLDVQ